MAHNTIINERRNGYVLTSGPGFDLKNNLVVDNAAPSDAVPDPSGNLITSAPMFVDQAGYNYRLLPGSPAIGGAVQATTNATAEYIAFDRMPVERIHTDDIGAYMFRSDSPPPPPPPVVDPPPLDENGVLACRFDANEDGYVNLTDLFLLRRVFLDSTDPDACRSAGIWSKGDN